MDINKWLAEVGPARGRDQPGIPGNPDGRAPVAVADLEGFKKRKVKRHQDISNDSSIIAPEDVLTEVPARHNLQYAHQHSVRDAPSENAGHLSHLENKDESDANPYQRRKRHKTKADLYDPKPREQETHQHGEKPKRKAAKKGKEAKRSKKDRSAPVVVRNFHAANVPRERLTLQPRANVGIFKKGKASSPFRGRGLPDLAFSEMNFLSKRRFAAEESADTEETRKRRKKDGKRATEEEISSYFAPTRPPLVEKSLNEPTIQDAPVRNEMQPIDLQRQSSAVPSIRPTIENPAAPELVDKKSYRRSTSNTYFTWSDSLRHSSRPVIIRPASTPDLEAYGYKSVSTSLPGKKVRASSYDLRPYDLVEKRQVIRSQTTRDRQLNLTSSNTNLIPGDVTTSSSFPRLNQLRGTILERATSGSHPPTAQGSIRSIDSHSLSAANMTPTKAAQQEKPLDSNCFKISQAGKSAPVLDSQEPTSASIANLLNDCHSAYHTDSKVRTTRLQPLRLDCRAISGSTNYASTIRGPHHVHQDPGNNPEAEEEDVLFNEQEDFLFNKHVSQMENTRTPEEQYYTYESDDDDESLHYVRPDMTIYGEQVQHPQASVPTRWSRYETHNHPTIQHSSMGETLMTDMEGDEAEALEQLKFVEEVEEEDGFAGFWKPNMLY